MAIKYVDTNEVKAIASDFLKICNDLDDEFNKFFRKMSEVPTTSKEWIGDSAEYYFRKLDKDKSQYVNFVNSLRSIGKSLNKNMRDVSDCISKNRGIE